MSNLQSAVDAYKKYFGQSADTVIEIGSRDAEDAYFLSTEFNSKAVYTFEANPKCHSVIESNHPNFNNICGAVSNFTGSAIFNAVESGNWDKVGTSSLRDRTDTWYSDCVNKIAVNVDTMENYATANNIPTPIDILKVDAEGCSYEVLQGFGSLIKKVKLIHVENETFQYWEGQKLADEVGSMLLLSGFFKEHEEKFGPKSVDEVWINGNFIQ